MPYNTGINRQAVDLSPTGGSDVFVPEPMAQEIIQELPKSSVVMEMAPKRMMSTRTQRMPVLSTFPSVYFVNGDSGLKQTTSMEWGNVELIVEEIAALVPIPDAYIDDASIPIWNEVKPRLVEAIGKKIDAACMFGTSKPSTWGAAMVPQAIACGNTVTSNNDDVTVSAAQLAEKVTLDGYTNIGSWTTKPGFKWRLLQHRTTDGLPVYSPDLQNGRGGSLYGYPLREVDNGAWDVSAADLLVADWTKTMVGVRQDITFKMFDQGIINDDDGAVIWNAMQQDGQALRVVMRLAWATAHPITALNQSSTRCGFGVLTPGSASS